ncbi:hypothetical protein NP493_2529g00006, partial [Ridgeia piscesae]
RENVALGRPADQSSTWQQFNASLAVDGNANAYFNARSCTATRTEKSPWWTVDLGGERHVIEVRIMKILYTDGPRNSAHKVCLVYNGVFNAVLKTLRCDDVTTGRFLFIQINGAGEKTDWLTLCEVDVYETKNIAWNKPAFMLSMHGKDVAKRATDGDEFTYFHTLKADDSWWAVDLGEGGARVTAVRIVNSRGCGDSVTLTCVTPMYAWGRYLFVAARVDQYFHLAEVEVFDGMLTRPFVFPVNNNNTITAL